MELAEHVERAVEDLLADYERLGFHLDRSRAERLFQKRGLSPDERQAAEDTLAATGVTLQDPEEDPTPDAAVGEALPTDPNQEALRTPEGSASNPFESLFKHQLLDPQTVTTLARRYALGRQAQRQLEDPNSPSSQELEQQVIRGREARDRLVKSNLRLVLAIARQFHIPEGLDLTDLVQDGVFGLLKAAERFDYESGYRFSTYATWWVSQTISRGLYNTGRLIRHPVHIAEALSKFRRATRALTRHNSGRRPTTREIAEEMDAPLEKVAFLRNLSEIETVSIDSNLPGTTDYPLERTLPSPAPTPSDVVLALGGEEVLRRAISELPAREQDILSRRFGLDGETPWTLEDLGSDYGLTRERIRQIERKALTRTREIFRRQGIEFEELLPS